MQKRFVSLDHPIGVLEFTLPPSGEGEGTLQAGAKMPFNDQGQLEVESLPQNTGPQRHTHVERELPKAKKPR